MADNSALLKNGNKILIENEPYLVIENDFVNPGKGQAFTRVKIRNLLNKKILEKTIKIGESIQEADVLNTKMQFLYKENETYFFMNLETYEQSEVISDILDENSKWLIDGDECDITIWNNNSTRNDELYIIDDNLRVILSTTNTSHIINGFSLLLFICTLLHNK